VSRKEGGKKKKKGLSKDLQRMRYGGIQDRESRPARSFDSRKNIALHVRNEIRLIEGGTARRDFFREGAGSGSVVSRKLPQVVLADGKCDGASNKGG